MSDTPATFLLANRPTTTDTAPHSGRNEDQFIWCTRKNMPQSPKRSAGNARSRVDISKKEALIAGDHSNFETRRQTTSLRCQESHNESGVRTGWTPSFVALFVS